MYDINFSKNIILFFLLSIHSFALEVIWERTYDSNINYEKTNKPIEAIQKDIAVQIQSYLQQRKPMDISAIIPSKIVNEPYPKPILKPPKPKEIVLVLEEFESSDEFEKRQQRERAKLQMEYEQFISIYNQKIEVRKNQIIKQDREYNQKVEERNRKIEEIKRDRDRDIVHIKNEYLSRQRNLNNILPLFASKSFSKYFGNPQILYGRYDYNKQMLPLEINSKFNNFQKLVQIKIDDKEAQKIKNNNSLAKAKIVYNLNLNEQSNSLSFSFNKIKIEYDNNLYLASILSHKQDYQPTTVILTTHSNSTFASDITPQKQSTRQEIYVPTADTAIPAPTVIIVSDNDLLEQLKNIQPVVKSNKKWLFVVGIEDYDFTDNVTYSKRTATTFVKVAQKTLGIMKGNSYVLIDDKATSGAIEGELKSMLEKIKEGDSIYFFYSGHGIPVSPDWTPYILPKDKKLKYITDNPFFKLDTIYNFLYRSKASKVIAIMDSCFSGSTDGQSVFKGGAGTILVPKKVTFNHDKMVVLTAGGEMQFSNKYPQKKHRLFSYFVMKSLLDGKRSVKDIHNDVYHKVKSTSNGFGDWKIQEPTIEGNGELKF